MHPCPYGFCYRIFNGRKNGNRGRYLKLENKCVENIMEWHNAWMTQTDGNKARLKDFMSCEYPPLDLFGPGDDKTPILLRNPPPPLHLYLGIFSLYLFTVHCTIISTLGSGVGNDAVKAMEVIFPSQMEHFYQAHNLEKGGMAGGAFNGNSLNDIMKPEVLVDLEKLLGPGGAIWIRYLNSLRELYRVLIKRELNDDFSFDDVIQEFCDSFELVNEAENGVNETLKESFTFMFSVSLKAYLRLSKGLPKAF